MNAMFKTLFEYLEKVLPLSPADKEIIQALFIPKQLMKGEFFAAGR